MKYSLEMNIINFKTINSTNKYVKQNIDKLSDKTVISTDIQTKGYGRFNRIWMDLGEENIQMTFVLKPSEQILPVYANLTQYLSVILCRQFEEMGLVPQIKWPNDVLLNGKKVCGILAETVVNGGKLKGIVLGIGVNLNTSQECLNKINRPATSVNLELGQSISKQKFIEELIKNFFMNYDEFLEKGFILIKESYENLATLKNAQEIVKISVFNSVKNGIFKGFDNDGTLLLLTPKGNIEKINMGELIN